MNLEITHRHCNKSGTLSNFAQEKFNEHIVKHFNFKPDQVKAKMSISKEKNSFTAGLHFDYKRIHEHFDVKSEKPFFAISTVINELERSIRRRKDKKEHSRKHQKRKSAVAS